MIIPGTYLFPGTHDASRRAAWSKETGHIAADLGHASRPDQNLFFLERQKRHARDNDIKVLQSLDDISDGTLEINRLDRCPAVAKFCVFILLETLCSAKCNQILWRRMLVLLSRSLLNSFDNMLVLRIGQDGLTAPGQLICQCRLKRPPEQLWFVRAWLRNEVETRNLV